MHHFDFSTQHLQKGSFSGSGFANADELAGFDHVDAEQNYTILSWEAMAGWVQGFDKGKNILIFGAGLNSLSTHTENILYTPRTGGPTIKYNDLVKASRSNLQSDVMVLPVLMGGEVELSHWCKGRGVVSRNFWSSSSDKAVSQSFSSLNGLLQSQLATDSATDLTTAWTFNTGLGLNFGAFTWDLALNTAFLASPGGGLVNPASQTTLEWAF